MASSCAISFINNSVSNDSTGECFDIFKNSELDTAVSAREARDNPLGETAQMFKMPFTPQRDTKPPLPAVKTCSPLQQRHDLDSNAAEIAAHSRGNTSI